MKLNDARLATTLAVTDIENAKRFYGDILGLEEVGRMTPEGTHNECVFRLGQDHYVCLYERPEPSGSTATVCSFEVDDVEATVRQLQKKGVPFEEYDLPEMGLKTKNGVATMGDYRSAWFKDPDGNILSIGNGIRILEGNVQGNAMAKH